MTVILDDKAVEWSTDELVSYVRLAFNSDKDGYVYGSNKELSSLIGISVPRVKKALDGLFERRLVSFGDGKVFIFGHEDKIKFSDGESPTERKAQAEVVRLKDVPRVVGTSKAEEVCSYFNKKVNGNGMPLVRALTPKRKAAIDARVREYGVDKVVLMIDKAASSAFLNGSSGWMASFDWIMRPNNFIKVLEGNYDDRKQGNKCAEQGYYQDTINLMQRLNSERKTAGSH